jgi:anti-anti-sigma regulatory factor
MGCTTILSGIAPEVAQTIVNLGINLDGIYTTSTLKDAITLSKTLENEK